jgi:single-strand DNA-binding protein
VVLQRFRGELVLLGGRGEEGASAPPDDYGEPAAGPARGAGGPARGGGQRRQEQNLDDLDDEIPF